MVDRGPRLEDPLLFVSAPARRVRLRAARRSGIWCATIALLWTLTLLPGRCAADAAAFCGGCQLSLGVGDTYHYWGRMGGPVIPATLTWEEGRYEVGIFRFTTEQKLYEDLWGRTRMLAGPYWGISASRRWALFTRPTWRLLFGFGASYKTQEDLLNSTHWNFASQLAVRLHHPSGKGPDMEFAIRHWSNGYTYSQSGSGFLQRDHRVLKPSSGRGQSGV